MSQLLSDFEDFGVLIDGCTDLSLSVINRWSMREMRVIKPSIGQSMNSLGRTMTDAFGRLFSGVCFGSLPVCVVWCTGGDLGTYVCLTSFSGARFLNCTLGR